VKRRRKIAAAAISASVLASMASVHPAFANASADCGNPNENHCYSKLNATTNIAFTDIIASIPSEALEFNDSPSTNEFLDGEFWVNDFSTGAWMETGFIKIYPHTYEVFWADNKPNCTGTTGCFFLHSFLYYGSDPTPADHSFEIIRNSTAGHWNIWYDGVEEGISGVTGMNSATEAQYGSELATNDSDKFYSCFEHCNNTGLGSGVWNMTALPYKSGSAYNWQSMYGYVTPSTDLHGGQNATYPWVWEWYKELQ
jgi:hypothetical protein